VVAVSSKSTDASRAATVANAYVEAYITHRRQQTLDESVAAQHELRSKIDVLQAQIDGLDAQIAAGQGAVVDSLRAQKQAQVQQQAVFKQTLDQMQVSNALFEGGAEVVRPATTPRSPARPKPVLNGVLAFVLGSFLGVGLAFMADHLDDSVKSSDDIENVPDGPPVIGRVPAVSGWKSQKEAYVVSVTDPRSVAAESYRAVRTAIQFLALDHPVGVVQITSSTAGEGKTTTLANLGVALSAAGMRVVMVCCDLRRPRIHEFFGLGNEVGFTSVLLGKESLSGALQQVPGNDHLFLLASGPLPPNPSELLSSARALEVLTSLQAGADIVLVDSPPVLPVTDALVLSGKVDATLMVVVAGATTRKDVARTVELLRRVDAPLVGAVLNGVGTAGEGKGYGYAYAQYDRPRKRRRDARRTAAEEKERARRAAEAAEAEAKAARKAAKKAGKREGKGRPLSTGQAPGVGRRKSRRPEAPADQATGRAATSAGVGSSERYLG